MDPLINSIEGANSTCAVSVKVICEICGKFFKGKKGLALHMSKSKCKFAKIVAELPKVQVEIEEIDKKLLPLCSVCHRSFKR